MTDAQILAEDMKDWKEGEELCGDCSPWGFLEEQAYEAWRESAESAGHFPDWDGE